MSISPKRLGEKPQDPPHTQREPFARVSQGQVLSFSRHHPGSQRGVRTCSVVWGRCSGRCISYHDSIILGEDEWSCRFEGGQD